MSIGLIGTKIGMTREFMESGQSIPVTVIKVEKGRVLDVISEDKRGYSAVKLGFFKLKNSKLTKQMKGYFSKKNTEPKKILKEFRVENNEQYKEGNELGLEIFKDKKFLDVRSKTIGKGFAGVMKRWNFGGLRASHGVSVSHRSHGSTGQRQDPGKVFKGKKMAGHMGAVRNTTQNIEVVSIDDEDGVILLCGAVPGPKNGWVLISDAIKATLPQNAPFPAGFLGTVSSSDAEEGADVDAASNSAPVAEAAEDAAVSEGAVTEGEKG